MTQAQVREVVKITIEELTKAKLINTDSYQSVLKITEPKLYKYFNNKGEGTGISYVLHCLSDDKYIDVIYCIYRDKKSIEWLAEWFNVDVSTIKRNKKRLIYKIYEMLKEL